MAIIAMKKLRLLGLKKEEKIILDKIHQTKRVEIKQTSEIQNSSGNINAPAKEEVNKKLSRLSFAINLIEDSVKERYKIAKAEKDKKFPKPKKPLFSAKSIVSYDNFSLITDSEYELFSYVDSLEMFNERLQAIKNENSKQANLIEQLKTLKDVDIPLNYFKDTKNTCMILGTFPADSEAKMIEYIAGNSNLVSYFYKGAGTVLAAVIICHKDDYDTVAEVLSACSFSRIMLDYDLTPVEKINECRRIIKNSTMDRQKVFEEIINLKSKLDEIKLLYDYYNLENYRLDIECNFKNSEKTFILEAYVPVDSVEMVKNTILSRTNNVVIEFLNLDKSDDPPIFTKNNKFVAPYEGVTNMYSAPNPKEIDPNKFVSIFFFMFFGLMLPDAGYGILLSIGSFLIIRYARLELGTSRLIKVIGLGGLSSIFFGIIMGGWFSIDITKEAEAGNGIAIFLRSLEWFNPMEKPVNMLLLCLGVGFLQIMCGLGIKFALLVKRGKTLDAFFDVGSWYLFFIGILMILGNMFLNIKIMADLGLYILLFSIALLIFTQGREKKGLVKKTFGGIGSLYSVVGFLSDILSYSRIFGLGLASGVVGLVFNTIASMLFAQWYLIWLGVAVLIVGHIFNIGINVLSAYIHNCRLQYIEFFSRFYTGGGHVFRPYGSNLKYYKIV